MMSTAFFIPDLYINIEAVTSCTSLVISSNHFPCFVYFNETGCNSKSTFSYLKLGDELRENFKYMKSVRLCEVDEGINQT